MGDMLASAKFPDVDPGDIPEDAQFSMVAGDFLEVNVILATMAGFRNGVNNLTSLRLHL